MFVRLRFAPRFCRAQARRPEPRESHFGPARSLPPAELKNFNGRLGLLGYSDEDAPLYARGYDVASCDLRTIEPDAGLLSPSRLEAGTVYEGVSWRLRKSSIGGFLPLGHVESMLEGMW